MADPLSESLWTSFTRKQKLDLDDAALVKVLARFDKTPDSAPEAQLSVIDEVLAQVARLQAAQAKRKKELGDKVFAGIRSQLDDVAAAAEARRKSLQAEARQREAQQKQDSRKAAAEGDEDGEDSPALLTTKLIPLLREVRKGESTLQALVAVAGKESVLLLSRRPIATARHAMLKAQFANPGGIKFLRGECRMEEGCLTFILQASAAGLAKKLKAALLAQTQLRLKVRVRGEDPADVDEEGGDDEQGGPPRGDEAREAPAAVAGGEAGAQAEAQAPPPGEADGGDAASVFKRRLQALLPRATAHDLRAMLVRAADAASRRDFDLGLEMLDEVTRLLQTDREVDAQAAGQAQPASTSTSESESASASGPAGDPAAAGADPAGEPATPPGDEPADAPAGTDPEVDAAQATAAFKERLKRLLPQATDPGLRGLLAAAGQAALRRDFDKAQALLDQVTQALKAGPGAATPAGTPAGTKAGTPPATALPAEALEDWAAEREGVIAKLRTVAGQIAAAQHVKSAPAILEIQTVIQRLAKPPTDAAQLAALQAWVDSDPVVEDVSELAHDIRTPLLALLGRLQARLQEQLAE